MKNDKYLGDEKKLKELYEKLDVIKGNTPQKDAALKRERGYLLEKLIYSVLLNEKLQPSTSYALEGEQVDGNFIYLDLPFLLEAKWHAKPIEASKIYAFKGKVDGKFHLSSGIFISMSGYSDDAPDALRIGKTSNLILFDKQDMHHIFSGGATFHEILRFKMDKASFYGELYVPFQTKADTTKVDKEVKPATPAKIVKAKSTLKQKESTKKKVLIISPSPQLLQPFIDNTLGNLNIFPEIAFSQMPFISSRKEDSTVKNIHRTLVSIPIINSFQAIILLYPMEDEAFIAEHSDIVFLNEVLLRQGVTNGAILIMIDKEGRLTGTQLDLLNNFLIRLVNPQPLF
jgi:hypothetical protein